MKKPRGIMIDGQAVTVALEEAHWTALLELCERESLTPAQLCAKLNAARGGETLEAALESHIQAYFGAAARLSGPGMAEDGEKPRPMRDALKAVGVAVADEEQAPFEGPDKGEKA